ncbi:MAG TPA: polysaccharide lyase [Myxococcales bacterium]|nr:polysaccharide lyase [Myxococcales bacterium]
MRLFALPALLVCLSTAASASVLWRGDYETGDFSQWTSIDGLSSRLSIVQSPVRQGKYALRAELHQGDIASSGTRNELVLSASAFNEVEGNDRWYAWSTMFPTDFPAPNTWQVFTQWHHSGCCGSPPVEFDVLGETIQLAHDGGTILWSTPLVRGVWHDFAVHVYWSSTNGYVELYYDGTKVLDRTSVQTLYPGTYAYMKQGLYRDASITPIGVVYHDGMTMGTTLADVAPQLVAPPPAPPPAPVPDAGTPDVPAPVPAAPEPLPPVSVAADGGVPVRSAALNLPAGGCSQGSSGPLALLGLLAGGLLARRRRV